MMNQAKKRDVRGHRPPTSNEIENFSAELAHAGDRGRILARVRELKRELLKSPFRDDLEFIEVTGRAAKKNFAQRFSASIAQKIADELRKSLSDVFPDAEGRGHESLSRGAHGLKKLDVNYSTKRSGLELAVSVKTMNFADEKSNRYTKNVKRVDGELRAEAQDCHGRQPHAVLAAFLFMPKEAAMDGGSGSSSANHAAKVLGARSGRVEPDDARETVELSYVGLYDDEGRIVFTRPEDVPASGMPSKTITFASALQEVRQLHARRNPR